MAIKRDNILSLIGSRRYHSAILTTFSFDFYFFEMKAMKWLRSCGVRNVNVLIDGHYYAELMQQGSGMEMQLTPGYSLYPIFQSSIFHPKLWMLFGEKEGLLIIGSGNLTNGGNGNNEEIWGAFHFDIQASDNAPIFSAAWAYVQQLCSSTKGIFQEKTSRWIQDHSKWVHELPTTTPGTFSKLADQEQVAFLANVQGSSIWQQLVVLLSPENVVEITTISPYYDRKGKAVQELSALFPSARINVVIDDSGLVPASLPPSEAYLYYDWYTVGVSKKMLSKADDIDSHSKLHAKIIHFKTNTHREYCLFGSANVTPEGLGLSGVNANVEASVLIRSEEGGLLTDLGIKLKSPTTLSSFTIRNSVTIFESVIKGNRQPIKILSAEWIHNELYLYIEGNVEQAILIKLFDTEYRLRTSIRVAELKSEFKVKVDSGFQHLHQVQLYDETTDHPISNKILLSDYYLLAKTNPNSKSAEIDRIINEIHEGELVRILDLLHYAMLDDTESMDSANFLSKSSNLSVKGAENDGPDKLYELSSYTVLANQSAEKNLLIASSTLRVLDVIKLIRSKEFASNHQSELSVDEQEEDLGASTGVESQEKPVKQNESLATLKSEQKKLNHYFKKLREHQLTLLYAIDDPKEYRPSFSDLTKYMIAVELMLEYGGKTAKYTENDKEHLFHYLEFNDEPPYRNYSVKTCCLELIGDFLMLARYGFKPYGFEYTHAKTLEFKAEALVSSIVCLLNNKWRAAEMPYFNTLLLNCLHYLGEKNPTEFGRVLPSLKLNIIAKLEQLKNPSSSLQDNLVWLEKKIIPAFERTIIQLEAKQFGSIASKGEILYKSPLGYCFVRGVTKENEFTLVRPGFLWDDGVGDFLRHTNTDKYEPVRLSSFVRVLV